MFSNIRNLVITLCLTVIFVTAVAAQPSKDEPVITNQDVVKKVKLGLDPNIIVSQIEAALPCFDVSDEGMSKLSKDGVPPIIIATMIKASSNGKNICHGGIDYRTHKIVDASGNRQDISEIWTVDKKGMIAANPWKQKDIYLDTTGKKVTIKGQPSLEVLFLGEAKEMIWTAVFAVDQKDDKSHLAKRLALASEGGIKTSNIIKMKHQVNVFYVVKVEFSFSLPPGEYFFATNTLGTVGRGYYFKVE